MSRPNYIKEIEDCVIRQSHTTAAANLTLERVKEMSNNKPNGSGITKEMTCPRCGKPIKVGLHDAFKCPCGWPEANGKGDGK